MSRGNVRLSNSSSTGNCPLCFCMDYRSGMLFFAIFNMVITGIQLLLPLITTVIMVVLSVNDSNNEAFYMLNQQSMRLLLKPPTYTYNISSTMDSQTLKSDLHIWAGWLLMQFICFCYSVTLFNGVKLMCYKRCLSWLSINIPLVSFWTMSMTMELTMNIMPHKSLKDQVFQYLHVTYGMFSAFFVYHFMTRTERVIRRDNRGDEDRFDSPVKFLEMSEKS